MSLTRSDLKQIKKLFDDSFEEKFDRSFKKNFDECFEKRFNESFEISFKKNFDESFKKNFNIYFKKSFDRRFTEERKSLVQLMFDHFVTKDEFYSEIEKLRSEMATKEDLAEVKDMILSIMLELGTEHEFRYKRIEKNSSDILTNKKDIEVNRLRIHSFEQS